MKKSHGKKVMRKITAGILFTVLSVKAVFAAIPYPEAVAEGQLHGWLSSGEYYWYYNENGQQVVDGLSPDGYYLDPDGRWRSESIQLFGQKTAIPDRYMSPAAYGDFTRSLSQDADRIRRSLEQSIGTARVLRVNPSSITYLNGNSKNEGKVLLGLYTDELTGGWRFRLSAYLGNRSGDLSLMSTYDYYVFQYLLSRVSHVPVTVAAAIYENWQGSNAYGLSVGNPVRIGDVMITLKVVNGAADYYITGI